MAPTAALEALLWLISAVLVVPWLAAEESGALPSSSSSGCQRSCGGVDIPFPFGIGPDYCMMNPGFTITCNDNGNGFHKPFLGTTNVEVLKISLLQGQAQVLQPISSYCYNPETGQIIDKDEWRWDLRNTVYTFSDTFNKFTVVRCRTLAYIGDTRNFSAMHQTGCVAMCFQGKMSLNPCSAMGCCQTAIPPGLQYYHVCFDKRLNMSGINYDGGNGPCSFAVLMDWANFTSSTIHVNLTSLDFYDSRQGMAPVVLDWSIRHGDCAKPEYACVSTNSMCLNAANGQGYFTITNWRLILKPPR